MNQYLMNVFIEAAKNPINSATCAPKGFPLAVLARCLQKPSYRNLDMDSGDITMFTNRRSVLAAACLITAATT